MADQPPRERVERGAMFLPVTDEQSARELRQTWVVRGMRGSDALRQLADHLEVNTPPGTVAVEVAIRGKAMLELGGRGVTVPRWEVSVAYREIGPLRLPVDATTTNSGDGSFTHTFTPKKGVRRRGS